MNSAKSQKRILDHTLHSAVLSLLFLLIWNSSKICLEFMTNVSKRTGHLFCRMSLDMWVFLVASHDRVQVTHFWQEYPRSNLVFFSVHSIQRLQVSVCPVSRHVSLNHLASARFLYHKGTILPFVCAKILVGGTLRPRRRPVTLQHSLPVFTAIADSCQMVMV